MLSGLTVSERQLSLVVLGLLAACGLAMVGAGRNDDALAVHGFIVLGVSLGLTFLVISRYFDPEPSQERLSEYYDDPTRAGIILAIGILILLFAAWRLLG